MSNVEPQGCVQQSLKNLSAGYYSPFQAVCQDLFKEIYGNSNLFSEDNLHILGNSTFS